MLRFGWSNPGPVPSNNQARIGIATLVRHYIDINKAPGEEPFIPPTDPIQTDPDANPLHASSSSSHTTTGVSFPASPPSEVKNQAWGCIIENCLIKELVDDVRCASLVFSRVVV